MSAVSVTVDAPNWLWHIGIVLISFRLIGVERTRRLATNVGDVVRRLNASNDENTNGDDAS